MTDPKNKKELQEIIAKYLAGNASATEKRFVELYFDHANKIAGSDQIDEPGDINEIKARIFDRINESIDEHKQVVVMHPRKTRWWWAAAGAVIVFGTGGYFYFNKTIKNVPATENNQLVKQDFHAPQHNRATITLGTGKKVFLDSAANGTLATEGNVKLEKLADGKIQYNGDEQPKNEMVFNTLTNPRGSNVIDITLADGSRVWLNAGSSLKYPVTFTGNDRKVEITGEAYFEVAHDQSKPFKVAKGNTTVEVLGTHFNVNAYDDEENIKVTLLEGSVKLKKENDQIGKILRPGEQGLVSTEIVIKKDVNTEQVMAWKNGLFKFDHTDLKAIMRQVARWYDVEVSYEGNIPEELYNGDVPRTANASAVLKVLQYTGANFTIEGNKIIVRP